MASVILSLLITKLRTFALKLESKVVYIEVFNEQTTTVDLGENQNMLLFAHYPFEIDYRKYLRLAPLHVEENARTGETKITPLQIQGCRDVRFKEREIPLSSDCVLIKKNTPIGRDKQSGWV